MTEEQNTKASPIAPDKPKPLHEFEKAGLGKYPYRLVGVEKNAIVIAAGTPEAYVVPGSCCDYCYTAIMYEYWVRSIDNKQFKVGCDCILRLHNDPVLKAQAKTERARLAREARTAKKDEERRVLREKRNQEQQERQARWNEEREEKRTAYIQKDPEFIKKLQFHATHDAFLEQMEQKFQTWGSLTDGQERAARTAIEVLERPAGEYVGTPGDQIELTITVDKVLDLNPKDENTGYRKNPWGAYYLFICHDPQYNIVVYRGNSQVMPEAGGTATIIAKVKDHTLYQDQKQTVIERPKTSKQKASSVAQ